MRQTTLKGIVITGLTLLVVGAPAWSWTAGSIEVEVSESPMKISVSAGGGVLAEITGFVLGSRTVSSLAGQSIDGNRCVLDLGEGETVVISPVTSGIRFSGAPLDGGIVEIVMNDLGGHYFGCRGQVIDDVYSPDLRGRSMSAHVESGGEVWNANLGGPLFLCSRGYGSYFDTFARGEYHFAQNGETRLTHEADSLDWYLFYGPGGDRTLRRDFISHCRGGRACTRFISASTICAAGVCAGGVFLSPNRKPVGASTSEEGPRVCAC